jgi:hypothetical protein
MHGLRVWNSVTAMNKISRQLVFPSIAFAMTTLVAHAESIVSASAPGTPEAMNQMFNPSELLQATNDTTLSSFSSTSTLVVHSDKRSAKADLLSESFGVSLITPSTGKVAAFENVDHVSRVADATPTSATSSNTSTDGGAVDGAAQVVADASASVTGADASDISITTASTSQTSSAGSQTVTSADLTPATASPEPSSMILVSSMLIAVGCIRRRCTN